MDEERFEADELLADTGESSREPTLDLVHGRSSHRLVLSIHEVPDRFGLHEVELAVEICALRELARSCGPRACALERADETRRNEDAPVGRDLDEILSGIG